MVCGHCHGQRVPEPFSRIQEVMSKGDPFNAKDDFIRQSLIIDPKTVKVTAGSYQVGTFDIVLSPVKK